MTLKSSKCYRCYKMSSDVFEMSNEFLVFIDGLCADVCFVSTVGGSVIFIGVVVAVVIIP